jgi:hypothetical protein
VYTDKKLSLKYLKANKFELPSQANTEAIYDYDPTNNLTPVDMNDYMQQIDKYDPSGSKNSYDGDFKSIDSTGKNNPDEPNNSKDFDTTNSTLTGPPKLLTLPNRK